MAGAWSLISLLAKWRGGKKLSSGKQREGGGALGGVIAICNRQCLEEDLSTNRESKKRGRREIGE